MKKKLILIAGISLLALFALWTLLISFFDVKNIGPNNSSVGFATLNGWFHNVVGVNFTLYHITDWLGLIPIAEAFIFAFLGLIQLVRRKSILKVDKDIIYLGVFYIAVIAVYTIFEIVVINYRPTLIEGYLEASYPSSTTMLTLCVTSSATAILKKRIKNKPLINLILFTSRTFTLFMVIGRLLSGVHWLTDIIGGIFISKGLVLTYLYSIKDN